MVMTCLNAQAICFIYLFGLQQCVAMHPQSSSGPSILIDIPDVDDRATINYRSVVALRVVPTDFMGGAPHYVTVITETDKMVLKLTTTATEALPIGDASGLGDGLQVQLSDFTKSEGDERIHLEARDETQDSGQERRLTFEGGILQVPDNYSLYRKLDTNLLVLKSDGEGEGDGNHWGYEKMEQMDPRRVTDYPTYRKDREACQNQMVKDALIGSASACLALTATGSVWGNFAGVYSLGIFVDVGRRMYKEWKNAELVWMNVNFS